MEPAVPRQAAGLPLLRLSRHRTALLPCLLDARSRLRPRDNRSRSPQPQPHSPAGSSSARASVPVLLRRLASRPESLPPATIAGPGPPLPLPSFPSFLLLLPFYLCLSNPSLVSLKQELTTDRSRWSRAAVVLLDPTVQIRARRPPRPRRSGRPKSRCRLCSQCTRASLLPRPCVDRSPDRVNDARPSPRIAPRPSLASAQRAPCRPSSPPHGLNPSVPVSLRL